MAQAHLELTPCLCNLLHCLALSLDVLLHSLHSPNPHVRHRRLWHKSYLQLAPCLCHLLHCLALGLDVLLQCLGQHLVDNVEGGGHGLLLLGECLQ